MKTKTLASAVALLSFFSILNTQVRAATLGSEFLYQGRLTENGVPADGSYDLQFDLYNYAVGGTQRAPTIYKTAVDVSGGLFTVVLDFGTNAFAGEMRWLGVAVRTNGGGIFNGLSPRQPVAPTPYALYAPSAGAAASALSADLAYAVPWSGVAALPAGFADGVDNDTLYSAGNGLGLSGTQFNINFAGSGSAANVARSDHNHTGVYALSGHPHSGADITSGTVLDARLSGNVALRGGGNSFTGNQIVTGGSLGIGTATLSSQLVLSSASSFLTGFDIYNTTTPDGASGYRLQISGSGVAGREGNFELWKLGSSRNLLTLKPDGKLGIGTTAPEARLDVEGNIYAGNAEATFVNHNSTGNNATFKRLLSTRNRHAGFGVAEGPNIVSPIVWMYSQPGNAFSVMTMDYNAAAPDDVYWLMRVWANGDLSVSGDARAHQFLPSSDRNAKENFEAIRSREILDKVAALPITRWNFKKHPDQQHIGPIAQDFHAAFGLGGDDTRISTLDADGVALAAIQGLNEVLKEKDTRIERLEQDVAELRTMLSSLLKQTSGAGQ
ncbi:MAG TPA: tail fiber domain-containing protein [Verrucomicrobiae bacterium]